MCSNVNSREIRGGKKKREQKERGEKRGAARTGSRNLVEKCKPNREKIQEEEKREKGRIHEVARAWGRERERESECGRV